MSFSIKWDENKILNIPVHLSTFDSYWEKNAPCQPVCNFLNLHCFLLPMQLFFNETRSCGIRSPWGKKIFYFFHFMQLLCLWRHFKNNILISNLNANLALIKPKLLLLIVSQVPYLRSLEISKILRDQILQQNMTLKLKCFKARYDLYADLVLNKRQKHWI